MKLAALPALACLVLYLLQVPPVSGDKDGSEFTLVLALGGVGHPTGYPLYSLFGHLFVVALHGLGAGWAFAANAWSAVGGAFAVLFLGALGLRLSPSGLGKSARAVLAFLPLALFALNPIWTYEAVLAEVYSWHVAFVGACALAFVVLVDEVEGSKAWSRRRGLAVAAVWGALCGLGGAHHATALFVAAPLSLGLFWAARQKDRAGGLEALVVVAAALLPLTSYLFVAWRAFHPAAWQWPTLAPSWPGIWEHLTGAPYRHFLGSFAPAAEQQALLARYVYPVLAPAMAGTLAALSFPSRADRLRLWPLAAAAVLSTIYAFSYGVPDPTSYFLAPMALAVVLSGACASRLKAVLRLGVPAALIASLAIAALGVAWTGTGLERRTVLIRFDERVHSMWDDVRFPEALVLWPSDMATRLQEYQLLRGEKPNVEAINPVLLTHPPLREAFQARHRFDPLEGVDLSLSDRPDDFAGVVAGVLNAKSPLPVILFDPRTESVRMLRKR
ncbi:MAG: DUF2723 domain-containing protein [Myxococcales bacterium]